MQIITKTMMMTLKTMEINEQNMTRGNKNLVST